MIGRILKIIFFLGIIGLIINRLFNRKQKQAISRVMIISAWVYLVVSAIVLAWYLYKSLS
ncbi:protein MIGRI [Neisseria sp. S1]|uniref:protein MIGRI n=1 Tax=Neisseria sp. S1 TaxID=3318354 RepID=UPI003A8B552C